jgi:indolepyruvate ferredoxin oxidoreductase
MTYHAGKTRAVVNTSEMATADFVHHRDANLKADERVTAIRRLVGDDNFSSVAANHLARKLLGDTIYANVLMLGFAWQNGLVPVSLNAILRAIELNGVEVNNNKAAFGWGRLAAADLRFVRERLDGPATDRPVSDSLHEMIARRPAFLVDYQDEALARKYRMLVEQVSERERSIGGSADLPLTTAVARAYFKTLAYKDEYEVARLHVDTGFIDKLRQDFGPAARIRFHLAPPALNRAVDARGRPRKRQFGAWIIPLFRLLARMRRLRGTRFDMFGLSRERRMERRLISEFEQTAETVLANLRPETVAAAAEIAGLYLEIRGYGPVKEESAAKIRPEIARRLRDFANVMQRAA